MAEERINDIIAQEAFDQLKQLSADLSESNTKMSELIKTCGELRKSVSEAVDYKGMASAMSQVNNAATQYVKTSSDRLNVERQIKAEGEKMVKVLEEEDKQLFTALNALDKVRKSDEELAAAVVKVDLALESQKKKLKDVKDEVRDSGTINDEQKKKIAELTVTIGELNVKRSEMMRQLKEDANTSTAVNTSYRQMNAQLVMLRNAYKSLTEEERNNVDIGGQMREAINNLDERLKAIDKSIGSNQRNVGNYEVILEKALNGEMSMRRVMMDLQRELTNVEIKRRLLGQTIAEQEAKVAQLLDTEGKTSSNYQQEAATLEEMKRKYTEMGNAVNDLTEKTGFLRDTSSDMQTAVKNAAQDAGGVKAMTESIGLLTQGYNALNALMAVSGADSQQLADIYNRMMIIQNGLNSINKIALALQQQSIIRVKARAALDKVRLLYMKAQTGETAKQAAAEVAETTAEAANTAAKKANTVAEQANTAAKSGNAAATVAATAATGGLAAGEGVATATSFTLVGALKAVGLAIKSIPVIGWILAAISALGALTVLVYKHLTAEKELTEEQRLRKEIEAESANARQKALEDTAKEFMVLDRNVKKIHEAAEGSREHSAAVKDVADKLGVSESWLRKNIKRVDELTEAWKRVRKAQALSDAYVTAAANKQVEAEQKIIELQSKEYKERKKMLQEMGYSKADAKRMAQQENLNNTINKVRNNAQRAAEQLVSKSDEVLDAVQSDTEAIERIQKEGADNAVRTTSSAIERQKKAADSALEYYKSIIKQSTDYQNRELSKSAKGRLELLEKERTEELKKYNLTDKNMREELRKKGYTEEQIAKIDEYYAAKRKEILDDESRAIAAAYAVQVELRLKMSEDLLMKSKLSGKSLTDALIAIEEARYAELQRKRKEAFEKEVEGLDEHSQMYVAVKAKYDAQMEDDERKHQETVNGVRSKAFDKSLKDLKSFYETYQSFAKGETKKKDEDNPVLKLVNSLNELADKKDLLEAELKIIKDMASVEGIDNIETIVRELEFAASQGGDAFKNMWDGLTEGQQEAVRRYKEAADGISNTNQAIEDDLDALRDKTIAAFMDIGDAFLSIGDSMKTLVGDSVGLTVAMQAVAMAQVLTSQGIAIAKAIEAAEATMASIANDTSMPTAMKIMTIATTAAQIAGSVAAILAQIASAKQAIEQSRNAVSSAKAYAEGTSHHTGGDAVVGEGGKPELVTAGSKTFIVEKPTLIKDLPVGAKVTPLDVQNLREAPQQVDFDLSEVVEHMTKLEKRDRVHIDVGKNVYSYIVKGASKARILNKQFSH